MTLTRRGAILLYFGLWAATAAAVAVTRWVLGWPEYGQALAAALALLAATVVTLLLYPGTRKRRYGWRVVANVGVLGLAFLATEAVRERFPMDELLVIVGVILPLLLLAQLALDWPPEKRLAP